MTKRTDEDGAIHVVCGLDERYAPHLATLLLSIAARPSPTRAIVVHVLDDQIAAASKRAIERAVPGLAIHWYPIVGHRALDLDPLLQISRATFLRLLIDEVLPKDIHRLLYLDVDVIVEDRLDALWEADIGDAICAAVTDPGIDAGAFAAKFDLAMPGDYFNAGIMLFDMERTREADILGRALRLLLEDRARYEFADQDALNVVLWNRWHHLDPSWNFQRCFLYTGAAYAEAKRQALVDGPRIIHFTESTKPWQRADTHPLAWLYLRRLLASPFRARVMREGKIGLLKSVHWYLRYLRKGRAL